MVMFQKPTVCGGQKMIPFFSLIPYCHLIAWKDRLQLTFPNINTRSTFSDMITQCWLGSTRDFVSARAATSINDSRVALKSKVACSIYAFSRPPARGWISVKQNPILSRLSTTCYVVLDLGFVLDVLPDQPPQVPKCWQNGVARIAESCLIALTRPSRNELFIFVSSTSTVSPGAPPCKNITIPFVRDTHLPSAAMLSTTRSSSMSPFFMRGSNYTNLGFYAFDDFPILSSLWG